MLIKPIFLSLCIFAGSLLAAHDPMLAIPDVQVVLNRFGSHEVQYKGKPLTVMKNGHITTVIQRDNGGVKEYSTANNPLETLTLEEIKVAVKEADIIFDFVKNRLRTSSAQVGRLVVDANGNEVFVYSRGMFYNACQHINLERDKYWTLCYNGTDFPAAIVEPRDIFYSYVWANLERVYNRDSSLLYLYGGGNLLEIERSGFTSNICFANNSYMRCDDDGLIGNSKVTPFEVDAAWQVAFNKTSKKGFRWVYSSIPQLLMLYHGDVRLNITKNGATTNICQLKDKNRTIYWQCDASGYKSSGEITKDELDEVEEAAQPTTIENFDQNLSDPYMQFLAAEDAIKDCRKQALDFLAKCQVFLAEIEEAQRNLGTNDKVKAKALTDAFNRTTAAVEVAKEAADESLEAHYAFIAAERKAKVVGATAAEKAEAEKTGNEQRVKAELALEKASNAFKLAEEVKMALSREPTADDDERRSSGSGGSGRGGSDSDSDSDGDSGISSGGGSSTISSSKMSADASDSEKPTGGSDVTEQPAKEAAPQKDTSSAVALGVSLMASIPLIILALYV